MGDGREREREREQVALGGKLNQKQSHILHNNHLCGFQSCFCVSKVFQDGVETTAKSTFDCSLISQGTLQWMNLHI